MLKQDQEIIIELLIQQETFLAELYQVYSEKFPDQTDITMVNAVSYALDMEKSLFEKDIFAQFAPVSEKAKKVLGLLQQKTEAHAERIRIEKDKLLAQK